MIETLSKNIFLYASQSKTMNRAAKKWGLRFGASQVVAGETIESAVKAVKSLNDKGLVCTVDHLGEFVSSREEATEATEYCIWTLDRIAESGVHCNLSLKLTQLGLDIDQRFCFNNMRRILDTAAKHRNFVRIDMEDYSHCQMTLDLLKELRQEYENVGTVIQSYLYRALQDVKDLKGVPLRLVKGAYKESPEVAYQEKAKVDENFMTIIKEHLLSGSYTAIATHDHNIIAKVTDFVKEKGISPDQFEFQMLYGFRKELQIRLAEEGYTMRVYIPFGNDWFGYFMRRLAERPQNVAFALKGMFSR
ncbi:proline dehydrogenase family protein [Paludifilum halophilum]|uniref:proline dehydrogenase n=1 Tax=Paludifilum halophilum TaxID=1642702 RepID=A0A235BBA5_9BACL|nr:proline dehydrogenase [Paludifilum halophilum]OYD09584.1 proline dehydrogenase [Paludifilum halophilum]